MVEPLKPCSYRLEGFTGNRLTLLICSNAASPHHKKIVTLETCANCISARGKSKPPRIAPEKPQKAHTEPPVITSLGTLIYSRTGWEPPPTPPGYRSKSSDQNSDDAWVLVPLEPICKHLELKVADIGACGYHRVAKRCLLIDSFVGAKTCEFCEKREPIDAG